MGALRNEHAGNGSRHRYAISAASSSLPANTAQQSPLQALFNVCVTPERTAAELRLNRRGGAGRLTGSSSRRITATSCRASKARCAASNSPPSASRCGPSVSPALDEFAEFDLPLPMPDGRSQDFLSYLFTWVSSRCRFRPQLISISERRFTVDLPADQPGPGWRKPS